MTSAQLAVRAKQGDDLAFAALATRHRDQLRAAYSFFAPGLDDSDLAQHALIGLWHACLTFDPDKVTRTDFEFSGFIAMCVRRQLIDAVRGAKREKHGPLNAARSFDELLDVESGLTLAGMTTAVVSVDPADVTADRAEVAAVVAAFAELSPLEREALVASVNGEPMHAIQDRLGKPFAQCRVNGTGRHRPKSVENAIDRARRKLRAALQDAA